MCGIVGSINPTGKYKSGMERAMRELIWADTLRGTDATGLFCIDEKLKVDWVKEVVDGWTFLGTNKKAGTILRAAERHPFIMAHNRAATMGDKDNAHHAHPIVLQDRIALVHNGTLTSWPQRYAAEKIKIDHDSTAIATIIADGGPKEFVNSCYGAYSLVWYDIQEHTIHFLRNEDRPMALVYCEDDIIFYGSELAMVSWVAQRNNFKLKRHFHTEPGKLYTFEIGESEPKIEECKRKVYSSSHSSDDRFRASGYPAHRGTPFWNGDGRKNSRDHDDDDGINPELTRMQREAERLQHALEERDSQQEGKKETQTAGGGSGGDSGREDVEEAARRGNRRRARGTEPKDHGKLLDQWKGIKLGEPFLFSITDYGMVHESANGPQYTVHGEPASFSDFPELEVRGTIKVATMPQETLERSNKFFWGKVSSIFATTNGSIILWVGDIKESKAIDMTRHIKQMKEAEGNTDEEAVAVVHLTPNPKKDSGALLKKRTVPEEKEHCQGCHNLTDKSKLKLLFETELTPRGQKNTTSYRLCVDCCKLYGDDRTKVIPKAAHNRKIDSVEVRTFQ